MSIENSQECLTLLKRKNEELLEFEVAKCERCMMGGVHKSYMRCHLNKQIRMCEYPKHILIKDNPEKENTAQQYIHDRFFRSTNMIKLLERTAKENKKVKP